MLDHLSFGVDGSSMHAIIFDHMLAARSDPINYVYKRDHADPGALHPEFACVEGLEAHRQTVHGFHSCIARRLTTKS